MLANDYCDYLDSSSAAACFLALASARLLSFASLLFFFSSSLKDSIIIGTFLAGYVVAYLDGKAACYDAALANRKPIQSPLLEREDTDDEEI